jgi:hypothetical protein
MKKLEASVALKFGETKRSNELTEGAAGPDRVGTSIN